MTVKVKDYASDVKPTWCPGCGDFGILAALKQGLVQAGLAPHQVLLVSGIGCGSKLPDYATANGFMTLHGRALPVATGAHLANHGLAVITVHGDGDGLGPAVHDPKAEAMAGMLSPRNPIPRSAL